MGNIFGRETYYVSNVRFHPVTPIYEYYDDTYTGEEDYSQPYGWGQFFSDLCCGAEWEDSGWGGAVVGIAKRRGCQNQDHWALAFRPGTDLSQLPRRIDGFRTHIPRRCRRECGRVRRRVYVYAVEGSSDEDSSAETDLVMVE
ncbi:hypothetical protein GGS26DRAFT_589665 [Hypomontagnella submonticulosa]|nr:hypothetical protein GGS26DRAFT_589665 [Hypomontagnella submonticulosa]